MWRDEFDVVWNGQVRELAPLPAPVPLAPFVLDAAQLPPRLEKICAGCGASYRIKPSEVDRRHHCSRKCLSRPVWKHCAYCSRAFKLPAKRARRQRYCSQRCNGRAAAAARGGATFYAKIGRRGGLKSAASRRRAVP